MTRIACCPPCWQARAERVPLISTFAFSFAEFYCLECGGRFGWLEPIGFEVTDELQAHHDRLRAEWDEHAGHKILTVGARHHECEKCMVGGEDHTEHATDDDRAAHEQALAWLAERARGVAA
jgi:hypothetical protein